MNLRLILVCTVFGPGMAVANPIGLLGIGSSGFVQETLTSLNFTVDSAAFPLPGPPWNGDVNSATTLTFAGGPLIQQEGILINNGQPFGSPPPAGAGLFNPFLQFEVHSNLQYFLTGVNAGSSNHNCAGLTSGQSCSILVAGNPSPVVLTKVGTSTVLSIDLFGFATDGVGGPTDWSGGFSATIPNMSPLDIVQFFCGADNSCDAADVAAGKVLEVRSVSGSIGTTTSSVPEPAYLSLILIGITGIGLCAIRKRNIA